MAGVTRVSRVNIRDHVVAGLTLPGGMVFRWTAGLRRVAEADVQRMAPKRTGLLASSVYGVLRANQYASTLRIGASAPHARYVIEGTGIISGRMIMYAGVAVGARPAAAANPNWHGYVGLRIDQVQGQSPNDFITRGVRSAVRYHLAR